MMLEDASNKELLAAWKSGDNRAAQVLVQRYMLRLTALARSRLSRKLSRRLDPEDVVLSAWRSFFVAADAGRFSVPEDDNLWPLLLTMTLRKLSRQASRHTSDRRSVAREIDLTADDSWREAMSRDPSPEDAAILVDEVEALMHALDPIDRDVLALRLQGESHTAIAGLLNCSERSVGRSMQRVREVLAERDACTTLPASNAAVIHHAVSIERRDDEVSTNSPKPPGEISLPAPTISYAAVTLQKLIGSGGLGKVYRAIRNENGETVAVKYLKKRFWKDQRATHNLLDETRRVSSLSHPNIIRHLGWGVSPVGAVFVVMDWVDGTNVGEWSRSTQPGIPEIIACGIAVADALMTAHAEGIVHADVTPGNVLRGHAGRFILTDFGFAKSLKDETRIHRGGTPGFLAPEQVSDVFGPVEERTDVYGLGGLIFALVTGSAPTPGADIPEILSNVISSRPQRAASLLVTGIPAELDELLHWCLNKEPRERPSSMRVVRDALKELRIAD